MTTFRIALGAALLLGIGGASRGGAEPPRVVAAAGETTIQFGPATGDAEKDSVGLVGAGDGNGCVLVPRFSREVALHGPSTGDAEKDSLGFRLSGQENDCGSGSGGAAR